MRPQAQSPAPLIRRLPEGGAGGNVGKRVSSGYNRRRRLATRSSGKQQAERTAVRAAPIACPEESPQCARRRILLPPAGIDAPTPARGQGLQPYGALTLFFRWRKKSVQKKASGTATPGKSPLCPFWRRGSLCRAQRSWPAMPAIVRARSSPFSAVKRGGPFSLRCLTPLGSPAAGVGHTQRDASWDIALQLVLFRSTEKET